MPILTSLKSKTSVLTATRGVVDHIIVDLPTGRNIDVHVARYLKSKVKPRLVVFDQQTPLSFFFKMLLTAVLPCIILIIYWVKYGQQAKNTIL
jgi:hypothetical protein